MSMEDFNNNDMRSNDWLYSRLIKQKTDEIENKKKNNNIIRQ